MVTGYVKLRPARRMESDSVRRAVTEASVPKSTV